MSANARLFRCDVQRVTSSFNGTSSYLAQTRSASSLVRARTFSWLIGSTGPQSGHAAFIASRRHRRKKITVVVRRPCASIRSPLISVLFYLYVRVSWAQTLVGILQLITDPLSCRVGRARIYIHIHIASRPTFTSLNIAQMIGDYTSRIGIPYIQAYSDTSIYVV